MDPTSHNSAECTCHGRKCLRQLQTVDEGQPVLGEPAQPNSEIKGNQQMQLTRSRMACPLSNEILREPARIAVNELLILRTHLPTLNTFCRNSLSQDARLLLDGCRSLQKELQQPPSCTELEGYARDLRPMLLESYSRVILQSLTHDTRLKLALIVWHFDTKEVLRQFLRSPINQTAWETLHAWYQAHSRQQILYDEFRHSFDFLLASQLAPSQQSRRHPKSGDSPYQRQGQYITPVYPPSSSSRQLQPPVHHGVPAGGENSHRAGPLPQSLSTSLPPESLISIRSPRQNAATRSDLSTGTMQLPRLPYRVTPYRGSGKGEIRPNPTPALPQLGVAPLNKPQNEKS